MELDYKELGTNIRNVYLDSTKYQLNKDVPTFERDGKYVGDFFSFTMFELDGDNAPTFYHVYSPYDIITGKSTQQAAVLRSGELILTADFTPYMRQRTGVMTALVLEGLGVKSLGDKRILYLGTGTIARHDLQAITAYYPDLKELSYCNVGSAAEDFLRLAHERGIEATPATLEQLGDFDIIICHTNSKVPVLTAEIRDNIKQGAIITTFSSEDFTEVAPEFFDTGQANILIDWQQTIDEATELKASVESGLAKQEEVVTLKELFNENKLDPNKRYTIYRSHGTPMQNLAALQLLVKGSELAAGPGIH